MTIAFQGNLTAPRSARLYATLGIAAALALSAIAGSADSAPRGGHGGGARGSGHGGGARRGNGGGYGGRGGGGWGGGYYPASPLIYGEPYYCPPVLIYAPGYGYGYCD